MCEWKAKSSCSLPQLFSHQFQYTSAGQSGSRIHPSSIGTVTCSNDRTGYEKAHGHMVHICTCTDLCIHIEDHAYIFNMCNIYIYIIFIYLLYMQASLGRCTHTPSNTGTHEVIKKPRINLLMPLSPYRFFFFLIVLQAICTYHNQRGVYTCGRHPKNHSFSFH